MFKKRIIAMLFFVLIFFSVGISASPASASDPLPTPSPTLVSFDGDQPDDAPNLPIQTMLAPEMQTLFQQQPGLMMAASVSAGATIAEYDLPKVRLQVNDGYNLDQYLYRQDGEIAFDMDLQGLTFSAGESATLTLRVYDVDQNGATSCAPEVDKVYINDHYVGNLRGANDQWSESPFVVPAEDLLPDINHIRVEIDTLKTGCWAVTVDGATGYNHDTCPPSRLVA